MEYTKREFVVCAAGAISLSIAGCTGTDAEGTIPISIDNKSTQAHTLAIIVTDQDGNTEYHATTAEIQGETEKTLEEKISLPDSVPKDVSVRVLLDTGEYLEFTSTLDTDARIAVEISESDELSE